MDQIRKEIHTAFFNVTQLCQQFFRKYPQHYPNTTPIANGYPPYHYGGYQPVGPEYSPSINNSWIPQFNNQVPVRQTSKQPSYSKEVKSEINEKFHTKKSVKQDKKYEKKLEELRIQRQRQERERKRARQLTFKSKKKQRNTLKNLIKRQPRYAERPKFPMSPYFLFLQEMRTRNNLNSPTSTMTNKQFAQQMGKQWRQMTEEIKKPYVTEYLKSKKTYDDKLKQFYEKYPDLKPKSSQKYERPMYSADDPKYQIQVPNDEHEQELESDLIQELRSEEQGSNDHNENFNSQDKTNRKQNENNQEDFQEEYSDEPEWNKGKDSLSSERLTSQNNGTHLHREVVEIDD